MDIDTFNIFLIWVLGGGWLAARLADRVGLPRILGMLVLGLLVGLVFTQPVPQLAWDLEPLIKGLALIIILLRAGLAIQRQVLVRVGRTAFLLAVVPCTLEAVVLTGLLYWVFDLDWLIAALAAWMLAAVSPAVVVPTMLDLQQRGIGRRNQVPTLIMASAAVDDVVAITLFTALLLAVTGDGAGPAAALGLTWVPLSVLAGVLLGAAVGWTLAWWFQRAYRQIRATDKALLLVVICLLLVEVGDWLAVASLLAVMTVGFLLLERAEPAARELADKLAKFWIPLEILLFVFIGLQVDPAVAWDVGLWGLVVIAGGLVARSLGVLAVTASDRRLNADERWFCVAAYLPKATVQAALGAVPLGLGIPGGEIILSLAVLAILVTAPLGLIALRRLGPKLP